jgi:hypothetical protein
VALISGVDATTPDPDWTVRRGFQCVENLSLQLGVTVQIKHLAPRTCTGQRTSPINGDASASRAVSSNVIKATTLIALFGCLTTGSIVKAQAVGTWYWDAWHLHRSESSWSLSLTFNDRHQHGSESQISHLDLSNDR